MSSYRGVRYWSVLPGDATPGLFVYSFRYRPRRGEGPTGHRLSGRVRLGRGQPAASRCHVRDPEFTVWRHLLPVTM